MGNVHLHPDLYPEPGRDIGQAGLTIDNMLDSMQRLLAADINHSRQEAMVKERVPSSEIQIDRHTGHGVNE